MKIKKIYKIYIFIITLLTSFSCNYNPRAGLEEETPTRGKIRLGVDECYTLLLQAELDVFQNIYENAHIIALYKPEIDVINDLINDSIRVAILSRQLADDEIEYFQSRKIYPKHTLIAYDAIAFIIHKKNNDSLITYNQIKSIFEGKISNWSQINSRNYNGNLKVVFDNNKSSTVRYIVEKFNLKGKLPNYCYAVYNNEEVIKYVEKNLNALGVISVSWIADKDDSVSKGFLKRIKVVAISDEDDPGNIYYYKPYQGFIADKSYPFIREVYAINRESFSGLGSGFVQWIASDQGQRVVLKMGLVPATMPIRLIKTKKSF